MPVSERTLLLETNKTRNDQSKSNELSVLFAIICIVDVFGVFPIIALPKAIIDCGYYGLIIITIVCSGQIYTANLLGKCWIMAEKISPNIEKKNRYPYAALAELTYGKTLSNFVCFLLDITVFGGGIPNLIVASQNLELLGIRVSDSNFHMSYCFWMIILGGILCPLLWLGSPKDMKLLCSISVTLVIFVFLLVSGCLIFSTSLQNDGISENFDSPPRPLWEIIFAAYGIISFQFDIHPSILTIQVDMKDKTRLLKTVIGGFACTLGMFGMVTIVAASKYGGEIKPSILETLPTTIPLHFAAVFVAAQLCLSSAVSNSALYQHMEDCMQISRAFNHRRCVLRTTLTLLAILIAEVVPKFDLVMSLIGGTLTAPLIFILPPMFYIRMLSMTKKHDQQLALQSFTNVVYEAKRNSRPSISNLVVDQFCEEFLQDSAIFPWKKIEIIGCAVIILTSICCTIATTYVNIKSAMIYANFSQPCIYNVSSALLNL